MSLSLLSSASKSASSLRAISPARLILAVIVSRISYLGNLDWLLIDALILLNYLEDPHALDHSSKHHILLVQETQRSRSGHVKLALVSVRHALLLAHAQKTYF